MSDSDSIAVEEHADHVEPIAILGASVAVDPHAGGPRQLFLLPPVNRLHWLPEALAFARLHFNERDSSLTLDDEIDVATPGTEPTL